MSILQTRRWQKADADLTAVAASGLAAAWTAYTPTVAAGLGTLTTVSGTGRWLQIGKLTFVEVVITITANGTGSSYLTATLPVTAAAAAVFAGREAAISGVMVQGTVAASSSSLVIINYAGAYPGASGAIITISGALEST